MAVAILSPLFAVAAAEVDLVAPGQVGNYTRHDGLNCYQGHGGINIDSGGSPGALTLDDCLAHCDATPQCHCIVRAKGSSGKATQCWRREACEPSGPCMREATYETYTKPVPPSEWPREWPSQQCIATMEKICTGPKVHGQAACSKCLLNHSATLNAAGCHPGAQTQAFCGSAGAAVPYPDRRPPGPACTGCPNLVFSITDDQDYLLGA